MAVCTTLHQAPVLLPYPPKSTRKRTLPCEKIWEMSLLFHLWSTGTSSSFLGGMRCPSYPPPTAIQVYTHALTCIVCCKCQNQPSSSLPLCFFTSFGTFLARSVVWGGTLHEKKKQTSQQMRILQYRDKYSGVTYLLCKLRIFLFSNIQNRKWVVVLYLYLS